jgi:hypothetical protein
MSLKGTDMADVDSPIYTSGKQSSRCAFQSDRLKYLGRVVVDRICSCPLL